jgi:hypothetical protein
LLLNSPLKDGPVSVTRGERALHFGQGWFSRYSAMGRTAVKLPQAEQWYS